MITTDGGKIQAAAVSQRDQLWRSRFCGRRPGALGEAAKLGFKRVVVGKLNAPRKPIPSLEVLALENLGEIGDVFEQLVE